jgi:hypothetical protein
VESRSAGEANIQASAADLTRVWVQAEVYEKDLALLAEGDRVEATSEAFPRRTPFLGQVRKLISGTKPDTHSPRVQIEVDNQRLELRPGLYVTVRIKILPDRLDWLGRALTDQARDRVAADIMRRSLAVPPGLASVVGLEPLLSLTHSRAQLKRGMALTVLDSAVIDTGTRKVVYRETGPGMFEAVEVVVGPRTGEYRPVLHGLEAGQRVASAGAFLLDAETRLNPAIAAAYFGAARTPAPARLSPEDRALAEQQKTCPVTGKLLGSMGTPVRVDLAGKTIFLCCKSCEPDLKANPERYLSKLPAPSSDRAKIP